MNDKELSQILRANSITKPYFRGVWAANVAVQLKFKVGRDTPCFIIVNTDNERGDGEHWLVFFYNKNGCLDVFDPFGIAPYAYPNLENFFEERTLCTEYNTKCLQATDSNVCGAHCLFYAYVKCKKKLPMYSIINRYYLNNVFFNDCTVLNFVRNKFKVNNKTLYGLKRTTKCK